MLIQTLRGPHTFYLSGHDYMLSGDAPANSEQKNFVAHAMYGPTKGLGEIRQFYEMITAKLVRENSFKIRNTYQLDAVRE